MSSCTVMEDLLAAPSCFRCCPGCACCPALEGAVAPAPAPAPAGPAAAAPVAAPATPAAIPAIPAAVAASALPDCDVACRSAVTVDVPAKLAGRAASTRRTCSAISWGTESSSQREGLEGTVVEHICELEVVRLSADAVVEAAPRWQVGRPAPGALARPSRGGRTGAASGKGWRAQRSSRKGSQGGAGECGLSG